MTSTIIAPEVLGQPRVQLLLGRSALYEALALSLAYPEAEALDRLDALLVDLAEHRGIDRLDLANELQVLGAARDGVTAERLGPVHFALFEGSVLCSPHETEYVRDPFAKAARLADIAGFYSAFGLQVSTQHQGTPDNMGTELEFMALLTRREAYARVQGWDERAEVCRAAGAKFLESHLGRWVVAFSADLCDQADGAAAQHGDADAAVWFHAVGELLRATVEADLALLGVHPSRLHSRVVNDETDAAPSCPMVEADHESGDPLR